MPINDPEDLDRVDQEIRINELKHRAEELSGGHMTTGEMGDADPNIMEQFWQHVVDYESAPWTTYLEQLQEAGFDPPDPATLTDDELTPRLWELIERLARIRVFIEHTNHLNDRELYEMLWHEQLREETKALPHDEHSAWNLDCLGSGSDEDNHLYLKYFADEEWRDTWARDFPDDEMPDHEDPPYDRDRTLPRPSYGAPNENDEEGPPESA
jgi:hypothetical protein